MDSKQTVFIVDDDEDVRQGLGLLLEAVDQTCELYSSAFDFLDRYDRNKKGCLVLDIRMPRISGLDLQDKLNQLQSSLPIIFITGHGDIPMAVEAMRKGALDFIRKPFREQELLDRINEALLINQKRNKSASQQQLQYEKINLLSKRESEIFYRVANGDMNKVIASDLCISERTVEVHRSHVMKKLEVRTLAQLIHLKIEVESLTQA